VIAYIIPQQLLDAETSISDNMGITTSICNSFFFIGILFITFMIINSARETSLVIKGISPISVPLLSSISREQIVNDVIKIIYDKIDNNSSIQNER